MARTVAAVGVDLTVLHYAVWAFPHFTMLAAGALSGPLLLLSNIDPVQPGMVGMLAAGGALDQIGRDHVRLWGEPGAGPVAPPGDQPFHPRGLDRLKDFLAQRHGQA